MNQPTQGPGPEPQRPPENRPPNQLDYARPRHAWLIWLVLLLLGGAVAFFVIRALGENQQAATDKAGAASRPIPVVAAVARIGNMPIYLNELGTVTPFNTVTVHTRVDGQLIKVAFAEGQIVHEGDLLAEIDSAPYRAALEQAQGQLGRDQALLANANVDLKRYESASDTVTEQQLDTQRALVAQFLGNEKTDEGQVDAAKVNLDYCTIISPINGRVGLRLVDQGNIVHASDANGLAVITQLQPISVIFSIIQDDIPRVMGRNGTVRSLDADAFDRSGNNWLASGSVAAVDSEVDPTTAMVKLKATFDNADNALFPSQFVNVRMLVKTLQGVVIVPTDAVQRGPDNSTFVYLAKKSDDPATEPSASSTPPADPVASGGSGGGSGGGNGSGGGAGRKNDQPVSVVEVRNVTTNAEVDAQGSERSVIVSGLESGDVVVTSGMDKLQPGSRVNAKIVATSRPSTGGATSRGSHGGHGKGGHHKAVATKPSEDSE